MKTNKLPNQFSTIFAGLILTAQILTAQLYTEGHADVGFGYEDEGGGFELHPHWHAHNDEVGEEAIVDGSISPVEEYDAGDIIAVVPGSSASVAANNAAFNIGTGVAPGSTYWFLPQTGAGGTPFLGLGAGELTSTDWIGGTIDITLGAVNSPSGSGHFSLYQFDGAFNFYMSTADVGSNTGVTLNAGDHDHYSWAFTETGTWLIDFTASGTHVSDGFQSATETFAFNVVPEPSAFTAISGIFAIGLVLLRRRPIRS
jgi:surface-anchored protein